MPNLLHIEVSPRKERSSSIAVAKEFIRAYTEAHPKDQVETLDLWSFQMPEFDGETINAKYRILHGQPFGATEAKAWDKVVNTIDRFKSADKYLFSVPMWNFGIPYKLKHFIDVIVQPGQTFTFSPEKGYQGLLTGNRAAVICARGGEYASSDLVRALDFQKPYLRMILGFIGITDVQEIVVEPTLAAQKDVDTLLEKTKKQAAEIARSF